MDRYASSEAFRAALEERLRVRAEATGVALDRLRRRVAFERLLARLEYSMPGRWIVKGGMALEIRLSDRARRTKDLDLAIREEVSNLHQELVDTLSQDSFGDGFSFSVGQPKPLAADDAGRPGSRFSVDVRLAGRTFTGVTLDVVQRVEEIAGTTRETFPSLLGFTDLPPVIVEVVESRQHFAEKLHAYTVVFEDRSNTRVRDLPDMVLLIEDGLEPDAELYRVVEHLFAERNRQPIPERLPDPPPSWEGSYAVFAQELELGPKTLDEAVSFVRSFWADTMDTIKGARDVQEEST